MKRTASSSLPGGFDVLIFRKLLTISITSALLFITGPVLPFIFCPVKTIISRFDHELRVSTLSIRGDTGADGYLDGLFIMDKLFRFYRGAQPFGRVHRGLTVCLRQHDNKLLSSVSSHNINLPQGLSENSCY